MSTENQSTNNSAEQGGNDSNKVEKQFNELRRKFLTIFNGDEKVFRSKIPNGQVADLVNEMLKENREEVQVRLKTKGKALIIAWADFSKFEKQKKAELEKAMTDKKKEYIKQLQDFFGEIENVDTLAKEMIAALTVEETTDDTSSTEQ